MIKSMLPEMNIDVECLKSSPEKLKVDRILSAALKAVDPGKAIQKFVHRDGETLWIENRNYDLTTYRRVFIIGAGKASLAMSRELEPLLENHLVAGAVISKQDPVEEGNPVLPMETSHSHIINELVGGHPIPDERSIGSTQQLLQLVSYLEKTDLVICLISGGASALLTSPIEGISLRDLQILTGQLLACGATINEINAVRKHLDRVKGGGLARHIYPAQLASLILSDVVGNPLDAIASGPTVADGTTYKQAEEVLDRYLLRKDTPERILQVLESGKQGLYPETLKPGDYRLENAQNVIIGSNQLACEAACVQARGEGLNSLLLTTSLQGEARAAGNFLSAVLRQIVEQGQPVQRPACVLAGGETTVILKGNGKGGRNQEVALSTVKQVSGLNNIVLLTLATDGEDGPTDSAGAVVTGETYKRAVLSGLNPEQFLSQNNSYEFFDLLGDHIKIGPTGTNVNDLNFLFAF